MASGSGVAHAEGFQIGPGVQVLEGNSFCEGPDLSPWLSFLFAEFYSLLVVLLHLPKMMLSKSISCFG